MHITCKFLCAAALPEASLEDLTSQISALKGKPRLFFSLFCLSSPASFTELLLFRIAAEKEKLALEHHNVLQAQRNNTAELKDKLIQAEVRHAQVLKEVKAAGEAEVEKARKEFAEATGQLRKELEEGAKLLKQVQDRNADLLSDQAEFDRMVIQTDEHALSKFFFIPADHTCYLTLSGGISLHRFLCFSFQNFSRTPSRTRTRGSWSCGLKMLSATRTLRGAHTTTSLRYTPGSLT